MLTRIHFFVALTGLVVSPYSALAHDSAEIEEYSRSIVQIEATVDGTKVHGTGFFIDDAGHILTAGHNVLAPVTDLGGYPMPSKDVTVKLYLPDASEHVSRTRKAVVIYADSQLDLALLRAAVDSSVPLQLAPAGTLRKSVHTIAMTWVADAMGGPGNPVHRHIQVDNIFNPSSYHDGLIDISGSDISASSSGGPIFDEFWLVAGVFTKGKRETGEAAVPISYSSALLNFAGVSYPSEAVREVIEELRKDLVGWKVEYDRPTGNVKFKFQKRLEAGASPIKYIATFRVYSRKDEFLFTHSEDLPQRAIVGKKGEVVFAGIGVKIDTLIEAKNAAAREERPRGRILDAKGYAEVTIVAEFSDGYRINGLVDFPMEFK